MIRTLIRYSQRLTGLMLLATIAFTGASAQTRGEKALDTKPAERVVETTKSRAEQLAIQLAAQNKIAVGEKTGSPQKTKDTIGSPQKPKQKQEVEPKKYKGKKELKEAAGLEELRRLRSGQPTADQRSTQQGIAVGEPNGGSYKKKELIEAVPLGKERGGLDSKKKEDAGVGLSRGGSVSVPQRTKDAIGSPQKTEQKLEAEILIEKREPGVETKAGSDWKKKTNVEPAVRQKTKDATGRPQKAKQKPETGRLADEEEVIIALPADNNKVKRSAKGGKTDPAPVGGGISEPARRQKT